MQKTDTAAHSGKQLTFGSLFAGIGGFDLGFERAGMVCKWQVEIDDYATRVLAKHWPDAKRWPDVRTWPQPDTEWVDVICGGFPCQDISNAGKQAGIEGERSGLWSEIVRTAREIRPRFIVVENVGALLVRGFDKVLGDLAACGFDAEWECFPASAFGAYHNRDRVFIVAHCTGTSSWIFQKSRSMWESQLQHRRLDAHFACQGRMERNDRFEDEPRLARMVDGVSGRMDIDRRNKGCGNAVDPRVAEWIGKRIVESLG
jgi:DNA (cytosine-5)-methyltransferase 1